MKNRRNGVTFCFPGELEFGILTPLKLYTSSEISTAAAGSVVVVIVVVVVVVVAVVVVAAAAAAIQLETC
jgi:hypothetical protein